MRIIVTVCWLMLISSFFVACGSDDEKEKEIARIQDSIKKANLNVTGTVHVEMNRDAKNLSIARVKGFRLQIFTGKDRDEALKAKTLFIRNFPDIDNYLEYEEPNYKVRVGDFLSRFAANELLTKVNKIKGIDGSFIIRSMVNAELPKPEQDTIPDADLVYYTLIDSTGKEVKIPVLKSSLSPQERDSIGKVGTTPSPKVTTPPVTTSTTTTNTATTAKPSTTSTSKTPEKQAEGGK